MKKTINLLVLFVLFFSSCSKDDGFSGENLSKYQATWLLTTKEDSNGDAVTISGCENGRNKMIINTNNTGSIISGTTIYSGNGFFCGESVALYNYNVANSKIIFTNDANTYGITYQVISVNSTTLVVKKISINNNGTISIVDSPITETYTKQQVL
jgi:hypothetical protein